MVKRIAHRDPGPDFRVPNTPSSNVPATARLPSSVEGEADALLIGGADHLDGERQAFSAPLQVGHAGNRRDQSERAVPFAGVADGVVMRAQHQARHSGPLAFVAAADVSDRVEVRARSPPRASSSE